MKRVNNNFSRFYALIKALPGNPEELKESLVKSFTGGRTASLRAMTGDEYCRMCDSLDSSRPASLSEGEFTAEIKRQRSAVLTRMQKLGIDTSDWDAVDNFCLNTRIAGKVFRALSIEELKRLIPKLEAIARKPRPVAYPVAPTVPIEQAPAWSLDVYSRFPGAQIVN